MTVSKLTSIAQKCAVGLIAGMALGAAVEVVPARSGEMFAMVHEIPTITPGRYEYVADCTEYGCSGGYPCIVDRHVERMIGKGANWIYWKALPDAVASNE